MPITHVKKVPCNLTKHISNFIDKKTKHLKSEYKYPTGHSGKSKSPYRHHICGAKICFVPGSEKRNAYFSHLNDEKHPWKHICLERK